MLIAKNRHALHNFEILEKLMAGIVLRGYEVKALRETKVNLTGSYVQLVDDTPLVVGMAIGRYSKLSQDLDDLALTRPRQLLLNKDEIGTLRRHLAEKGKSAVPLALVFRNNLVKLEIALVKGKKKHEKKIVEKERQIKKDLDIEVKTIKKTVF